MRKTSQKVVKVVSVICYTYMLLKDATALDTWVLDRLTELFHNATYDSKLDAQLRSPGTVFFLHLLGLDTTGHAYRPHSEVSGFCLSSVR